MAGSLVGLTIAFLTLAGCQCDARPTVVVGLLLAWPLVVLAVLTTRRPWIAAAYLLVLGVVYRLGILVGFHGVGPTGVASDVLSVTGEALGVLLAGGNPYTHVYMDFDPPGATHVFPHPAGNLLYYLPGFVLWGERMRATEIVSTGVVLAVLAWSTRIVRSDLPVALMGVYAAAPPLLILATDNSNDTSAGALIFLAAFALLLAHRRRSSAILAFAGAVMGWAMCQPWAHADGHRGGRPPGPRSGGPSRSCVGGRGPARLPHRPFALAQTSRSPRSRDPTTRSRSRTFCPNL